MLLESPCINDDVDASWVKKTGFSGNNFTDIECRVFADIANRLRPFVPKRRPKPDEHGYRNPMVHVALRAPIVFIANSVPRAAGYIAFTRRTSHQVSPASLHGL